MPFPRAARIDEIDILVDLADRTFREPGQTSMGIAYATLFAKENADHLLVMEEEGVLATLVGLLQTDLSIEGCAIRVVSMGSVCTEPAFRGRQYADTLFKMSLEKCVEDSTHLMLVSGNRSLYLRNDCVEVGAVNSFTISASEQWPGLKLDGSNLTVRPYDEAQDIPFLIALVKSEAAYYKRTEEEFALLIRSAAVSSNESAEQHVWIAFEPDGEAAGYIVYGLMEKNGVSSAKVIEYAGSDRAVIHLLQQIYDRFEVKHVEVPVMGDRPALSEILASAGCSFIETHIPGTIRMINFPGLWGALQPYMVERIGEAALSELRVIQTSNGYRIQYRGQTHTVDNRGATRLVFNGPQMTAPSELKDILSKLFPLNWVYTCNLNFV
ncbi:GNAT family N-acetyltransferase [Paenibacillus frigoriresistens]|uniref:GNAT family N-acetyltransferase n=1 Tax=Paenibacillus alginolyticus TaxID=59839 RepID=UPI00156548D7|nr:GNAT family N-acetyltransferase [Paenibacillus frigoriresistens]NRF94516.1 GNAT family N-acetyltransferase [Paenibacillus frigoriresistens]